MPVFVRSSSRTPRDVEASDLVTGLFSRASLALAALNDARAYAADVGLPEDEQSWRQREMNRKKRRLLRV